MEPLIKDEDQDINEVVSRLKTGYPINYKDENGMTALHLAVIHRFKKDVISLLFEYKIDATIQDNKGNTALHIAASSIQIDSVTSIIAQYMCLENKTKIPCLLEIKNNSGQTALVSTAKYLATLMADEDSDEGQRSQGPGYYLQIMHRLLQVGANINSRDKEECNILHYLAFAEQPMEVLKKFINMGADPNVKDKKFKISPLCIVQAIQGAKNVSLIQSSSDTLEDVRTRFKAGCLVNATDERGQSQLSRAIGFGCIENVILFLLENGADATIQNKDSKNTPLHLAIITERSRQVIKPLVKAVVQLQKKLLVDEGPRLIDSQNSSGATPLICAAIKQDKDTIDELLRNGADINIQDSHGNTMLHYEAKRMDEDDMKRYVVAFDGDMNIKNNMGITPKQAFQKFTEEKRITEEKTLTNSVTIELSDNVTIASFPAGSKFENIFNYLEKMISRKT